MVKHTVILVAGAVLTAGVAGGADVALTAAQLPPGTVVRIAARRPAITLGRAQVVECTNRLLTVSHKREKYTIVESNLLELVVLERPEPEPGAEPVAGDGTGSSSDRPAGRRKASQGLWQRLLSFWK
jgi:hypothetical protein